MWRGFSQAMVFGTSGALQRLSTIRPTARRKIRVHFTKGTDSCREELQGGWVTALGKQPGKHITMTMQILLGELEFVTHVSYFYLPFPGRTGKLWLMSFNKNPLKQSF